MSGERPLHGFSLQDCVPLCYLMMAMIFMLLTEKFELFNLPGYQSLVGNEYVSFQFRNLDSDQFCQAIIGKLGSLMAAHIEAPQPKLLRLMYGRLY